MELQLTASTEDIKSNLNLIKIKALNLADKLVSGPNAEHLEPRELKTLVDTVLSIEDSYKETGPSEGEQARKIKRILDKYASDGMDEVVIPKEAIDAELLS